MSSAGTRNRYWVDFNNMLDDRTVYACPTGEEVFIWPQVGEIVEVYDADDESCWATVTEVTGRVFYARLWLHTWETPSRFVLGGES